MRLKCLRAGVLRDIWTIVIIISRDASGDHYEPRGHFFMDVEDRAIWRIMKKTRWLRESNSLTSSGTYKQVVVLASRVASIYLQYLHLFIVEATGPYWPQIALSPTHLPSVSRSKIVHKAGRGLMIFAHYRRNLFEDFGPFVSEKSPVKGASTAPEARRSLTVGEKNVKNHSS